MMSDTRTWLTHRRLHLIHSFPTQSLDHLRPLSRLGPNQTASQKAAPRWPKWQQSQQSLCQSKCFLTGEKHTRYQINSNFRASNRQFLQEAKPLGPSPYKATYPRRATTNKKASRPSTFVNGTPLHCISLPTNSLSQSVPLKGWTKLNLLAPKQASFKPLANQE